MAILNHHRSRSTRLLRTSTSSTGLTEDDDRDDARPHAKRRRATRAKFVNIAVHDSPSSQESASASSGRGRRGFFGKTVGNATRQALAVMNTNGFSASRLLARLPTRRGRSRGQPTPIKPLERQRSGASVNDADEEDLERWAGRKRKRGGEVVEPEPVTTLRDGKTRKVISTSQEHARRRRRSDDAMDVDVDEDEDEDEDDSVVVEDGEEEDGPNSGVIETDEFFISSAPSWRLHRLKREDLVRLYGTANGDTGRSRRSSYIQDDPVHHWTKSELVEALIATREHAEPATHSGSTRSSSLVRTPTPPRSLRRTKSRSKHVKVTNPPLSASTDASEEIEEEGQHDDEEYVEDEEEPTPIPERKPGNRNLTRSTTFVVNFSPRRTRSGLDISGLARSQSMSDLGIASPQRSKLRRTGSVRIPSGSSQTEGSDDIRARLRKRATEEKDAARMDAAARRTRFRRSAKEKISNLKEVSEDEELELDQEEPDAEDAEDEDDTPRNARRPARQRRASRRIQPPKGLHPEAHTGPLTRSASLRSLSSLSSAVATPIKNRLRSRKSLPEDEEEDGDDEEELEEEEDENAEGSQEADAERNNDADEDEVEESVEAASEEEEAEVDGEEEQASVIELLDDDDEEGPDEEIVEVDRHGNPIERDGDATEDDGENTETMEGEEEEEDADADYVDLADATVKSLTRMKRDDLVQLCEARELDTAGTKPQLAQALLEWRDTHEEPDSSIISSVDSDGSSGSTARPRTPKNRRNRKNGNGSRHVVTNGVPQTPILLRSEHIHVEQPATPPMSHGMTPLINVQNATPQATGHAEPELDLDLEELGLEEKEIPPDKLTKMEKIGSGGFKDVFVGKYRGRKVAIAEIRGQLSQMDIKELTLLRDFDHPNIVRFLGVSVPENTRDTPVVIVSELCANGDLYDYIRNVPPPPLKKVLTIMMDIANGLRYLHEHKPSVIHRDCKSSNILITTAVRAKIADFGLAKVKQSTRSMIRSVVGTVNWQAPELWHARPKYDYKVDVFSCAMVFWEMLQWYNPNKKYPWEGMNEHAIYEAVGTKRQRPSTSGLRKQWTPPLIDLVERMWLHDASERPTMAEVHAELHRILSEL